MPQKKQGSESGAHLARQRDLFRAYLRRNGLDDAHVDWLWPALGLFLLCALGGFVWYYTRQTSPLFYRVDLTRQFFQRLLTLALGGVAGFLIGAFFSPLLKPFRLFLWIALGILVVLYGLFGDYPQADTLDYVLAGIAFLITLSIGLKLGLKSYLTAATRHRPTSFGSAQWATYAYLHEKQMFGHKGLRLGAFDAGNGAPVEPLHYTGARHLLTIAPTRSGKGVSSIIPNLLTYPGSVIVVDPKGENALITADRRGAGHAKRGITGMGQKIVLLDPWQIAAPKLGMATASFNPLDWIKADDPDAAENAFLLADALVMTESSKEESRFWDEEAKALLTGMILYVATSPNEADNRTLGRVRDILCLDDARLRDMLEKMYQHPNPIVRSTAARTALKDDRLMSSVMASVQSHTHFLDSPRLRESLSRSDFSFADLKTAPVSIYLILPADRLKTFGRWLRLLIQEAITVNARNIEVTPTRPILFMLDEMPSLGRLPALEQAFSLMAGFGMQLWGVCQDLSQLARIYGENGWQTFISNSGVLQYFGSRDKMTAEYFSTLCGVTTIEVRNFSWAVGKAISYASSVTSSFGGSSSSRSTTTSHNWTRTTGVNEAQRKLAYPDELMVMRDDQQLVFVENLDPITGKKIPWFKDTGLREQGIDLTKPIPLLPPVARLRPAPPVEPKLEVPSAPIVETNTPRPVPEPTLSTERAEEVRHYLTQLISQRGK